MSCRPPISCAALLAAVLIAACGASSGGESFASLSELSEQVMMHFGPFDFGRSDYQPISPPG